MNNYICTTCGTQFSASPEPPDSCPICEDPRQYVNHEGQQWTTSEAVNRKHKAVVKKLAPRLYSVGMAPRFGIGQRAMLLRTDSGNILWDCIGLIDETITDLINGLGGLSAIAISHPHFYTTMVSWSKQFGDIPVYLHNADRPHVMNPHKNLVFWEGDSFELHNGITLHNLGGHFEGGAILHWPEGANGKGALLTGDIIAVAEDRKHVSFMYSFPNLIPLSATTVDRMNQTVQKLKFDRIYGAFWDAGYIATGAKKAVDASALRYIKAVSK